MEAAAIPVPQPPAAPPSGESAVAANFARLKLKVASYLKPEDVARVEAAYHFSTAAHEGQFRISESRSPGADRRAPP
jgi:GTP diphosphokinase / guanosine-3',5'-bis(diphosphate) 3'-diphosphatase